MNNLSNTTEQQRQSGPDEDAGLVKRCQAGNRDAFEELVVKYQQKVFSQCFFLLGNNRQVAEDAAQEVFCKVWRGISGFKGDSKLSSWLHTIARNHCFNLHTQRSRNPDLEQDGEQRMAPVKDTLATEDCVRQKVSQLEEIHRSVIALVHFDELSYEEAADILGCPVGTIRSRVNRALEKLRPLIRECL